MGVVLTPRATEGSTFVVTVPFTDEDGDPVTPSAVTWTLVDEGGAIVNSHEDEPETPAATVAIVLTGPDLPADGYLARMLYLTVTATYDSALGLGLTLVDQTQIEVIATEVVDVVGS